jgi:oxygen-independent coproporphyrinogen III oxidase
MTEIDPARLAALNLPVPRYTSYPTAPEWGPLSADTYKAHLLKSRGPLSLYIHVPFCRTMCLYCACSVVLNRNSDREEQYVDYLLREIDLVTSYLPEKPTVNQLHFGGGTPTQLTEAQLTRIVEHLSKRFNLDFSKEIAMEIDPRTVVADDGAKLRHLRALGFNRVSFGVQDTNPKVQETVKRRQSLEVTQETYHLARELGFEEINMDLIYGLPHQTRETFRKTVDDILEMGPNRIAMYSYAKVPWLKPHQKAIKDTWLPSTDEKFAIYVQAREQFMNTGYIPIGMDHFARADDSMAKAFHTKSLQRNFQGYSLKLSDHLLGLGVTSTGYIADGYFQNLKTLDTYYSALDQDTLPILRGKTMTTDDRIRKWTIHTLMCNFELDKADFEARFHIPFDTYFTTEMPRVRSSDLVEDGPILRPTLYGSLFIRNIASLFDAYLKTDQQQFSRAV